jgi:hypothetical protein
MKKIEKMECPICFKICHQMINLECGHKLCRQCCRKWILNIQPTCPFCRKMTFYYNRTTRSFFIAKHVKEMMKNAWQQIVSEKNGKISIRIFVKFIETYFLFYIHIWRRPHLSRYVQYFRSICLTKQILKMTSLTISERDIIKHFISIYI